MNFLKIPKILVGCYEDIILLIKILKTYDALVPYEKASVEYPNVYNHELLPILKKDAATLLTLKCPRKLKLEDAKDPIRKADFNCKILLVIFIQ